MFPLFFIKNVQLEDQYLFFYNVEKTLLKNS